MVNLLIIEDEQELRATMREFLAEEGFRADTAGDCFEAEDLLLTRSYDMILLDLTLPDGNGLNLIDIIRKQQQDSGILIISARDSLEDKLEGLDLGADDYITKPFHLAELNSRIRAIYRRKKQGGNPLVTFEEIKANPTEKWASVNDVQLDLTGKEFHLLLFFLHNQNRIVSKQAIAAHLWGGHVDQFDDYDFIYAHIKNLRKKLEHTGCPNYLKTSYGMGYKFTNQ